MCVCVCACACVCLEGIERLYKTSFIGQWLQTTHSNFFTSPRQECKVLWSSCLCVCLPVCSHISKTARPPFTEFSVHVCLRSCVLLWQQCNILCTSGFVDDAMFSHNGANGPESKTTRNPIASWRHHGAKSTVYDCILLPQEFWSVENFG